MTTATHESKTRSAGVVSVDRLRPNPWNKARPLDTAFVESIRSQGILSSLLIREVEDDGSGRDLEIICGERRWMGAVEVGREYVPAITVQLDDQAARVATLTENTHRTGLSPWQEAQLVGELLAMDGMDIAAASAATGWSEATVRRRAKLLDLSPSWKGMLEKGELEAWTAAHFEILAVFDEKRQEDLHKDLRYRANGMTVADVKEEIAGSSRALKSAPWDLDDVTLAPRAGACTGCEKRSDCQADLFGQVAEMVKAGASCLDDSCFGKKLAAFTKRKEVALLEKHPEAVKVATDYSVRGKGMLRSHEITPAKKGDKGAVPAIQYADGGKVTLGYVKVKKTAKPQTEKSKAKEEEAKKNIQIRALAIEKLGEIVKDPDAEFTDEAYPLLLQFCLLFRADVMGDDEDDESATKEKRLRAFAKKPVTVEELWSAAARFMERELYTAANGLRHGWGDPDDDIAAIERIAWMVDADFEALLKEAEEDLAAKPGTAGAQDLASDPDMDADNLGDGVDFDDDFEGKE